MKCFGCDGRWWIALICAVVFIVLALLVNNGYTDSLDIQISKFLHEYGGGGSKFTEFMRDVTSLSGVGVVVLLGSLVVIYLLLRGGWREALVLVALLSATLALTLLLKDWFNRPRPALIEHGAVTHTKSFPSGHSSMAAATCLSFAWAGARLHTQDRMKLFFWVVGVGLMLFIGYTRLVLGVHWFSDILAGLCLGGFCAASVSLIGDILDRRPEPNRPHALPSEHDRKRAVTT
jgi:undecaprenyl-diphosphatase